MEEPRIGVFICHCGVNIGGIVKVPEVVEYAKTLPHVIHAEDNLYTCSAEGLSKITEAIKQHDLNRVVVASCTPRTHEPLFRSACQDAGVNQYLFEMANIREQCSWVHMHERERATEKAKDLVKMAAARAVHLEPQEEPEVEIKESALVIGAGVSGMTAALSLADQGFKVHLLEKEAEIGGIVKDLHKVYPTLQDASEIITPMVKAVNEHENISLYTATTLQGIEGYIGNFQVTAKQEEEAIGFDVGTVIVASGAMSFDPPTGLYEYGVSDKVITQLQLEKMLKEGKLEKPERIVMIQCVGARTGGMWTYELPAYRSETARLLQKIMKLRTVPEEEMGWSYCSKICCTNAIKNALMIKEQHPGTAISILYGDLRTYKEYEEFYNEAREREIEFIRYIQEMPPRITETPEKRLEVSVYDTLAGEEIGFQCDWVVLSTPLIPCRDGIFLGKQLKIPLDPDGFLMEAHPKLRPIDTQTEGIFLAGTASGPKDIPEAITTAKAAAARAGALMFNKKMKAEAITSTVNPDLCRGCGRCEEVCEYGAITLEEGAPNVLSAKTNEVLCKGCGVCSVTCPTSAITMKHYTKEQIHTMVEAALA